MPLSVVRLCQEMPGTDIGHDAARLRTSSTAGGSRTRYRHSVWLHQPTRCPGGVANARAMRHPVLSSSMWRYQGRWNKYNQNRYGRNDRYNDNDRYGHNNDGYMYGGAGMYGDDDLSWRVYF
eukprot:1632929-Rhodomonas_salina.1